MLASSLYSFSQPFRVHFGIVIVEVFSEQLWWKTKEKIKSIMRSHMTLVCHCPRFSVLSPVVKMLSNQSVINYITWIYWFFEWVFIIEKNHYSHLWAAKGTFYCKRLSVEAMDQSIGITFHFLVWKVYFNYSLQQDLVRYTHWLFYNKKNLNNLQSLGVWPCMLFFVHCLSSSAEPEVWDVWSRCLFKTFKVAWLWRDLQQWG